MKVYKIGGSSLDCNYKLDCIVKLLNNDEKKVVVVSAIGRYPNHYATDSLLKQATYVSKEEKDLLVSTGEIISSVILSNYLNKFDISTIALSPYIFDINNIDINLLNNLFDKYNTIIIPGFVYTNNNVIYTMNRGGSTLSASLVASCLSCDLVIVTDVCGVYDLAPINPKARHIPILSYDEFSNLNKTDTFFPKQAIKLLKDNKIVTTFIKYDECSKCSKIIP